MTETRSYRCINCGHRFNAQILTKEEKFKNEIENKPMSPLPCPKCNRIDLREGWE